MSAILTFTPSIQAVSPSTTQFRPPPVWQIVKTAVVLGCSATDCGATKSTSAPIDAASATQRTVGTFMTSKPTRKRLMIGVCFEGQTDSACSFLPILRGWVTPLRTIATPPESVGVRYPPIAYRHRCAAAVFNTTCPAGGSPPTAEYGLPKHGQPTQKPENYIENGAGQRA